jgi:hypothetical protein
MKPEPANVILPRAAVTGVQAAIHVAIVRLCHSPAPESRAIGETLQREYLALAREVAEFDALHSLWGWSLHPPEFHPEPLRPVPAPTWSDSEEAEEPS